MSAFPSPTLTSRPSLSSAISVQGSVSSTTSLASLSSGSSSISYSSSSNNAPQQTHSVKVGAGGFKFEPQELKDVNVGDVVEFEFYPPDHSVARAEFGSPCVPYEYTGKDKVGFWSDTQWVKTVNDLTYFRLKINSTEPTFFYCAAPESCTGHQMVGVINPNSTQTLDAQVKAAQKATLQVAPGQQIPPEGTSSLTNTHGPTGAPSSTNNNNNSHHGLSAGVIAGIVVGAVAFLAICAALFFYVGRAKSLKEVLKRKDDTVAQSTYMDPHTSYGGPSPYPGSPGFAPGSPYSPSMHQAEYGQLPQYGQHNATDPHISGIYSSPRMSQYKDSPYVVPAELASPTPQQQSFSAAELEAPNQTKN